MRVGLTRIKVEVNVLIAINVMASGQITVGKVSVNSSLGCIWLDILRRQKVKK